MAERTRYQEKVIKRYYENRDAISLQRLQELATDLYLAEGKKLETAWKHVIGALEKLKVPQSRIDHLVKQRKPELVAQLVTELMAKG
jgi:hypothetical protein